MKVFIDVTSSCRSAQNTGMQRMTRRIFAELTQRLQVQPISWNTAGDFYVELGPREFQFLTQPFAGHSGAMAHPEWRGEDPFTESFRMLRRRRFNPEQEISAADVFFVPDIFRDGRRDALPAFLKRTPARKVAIFHDATDLRLIDVYPDRERKSRPYLEALALFDLVVCVSEEARDDLRHFWNKYGCRATETLVELWPGELSGTEPATTADESNTSVLYVSSFHGRKNHLKLLYAAEQLWREGIRFDLKLIGRNVGGPLNKIVREIWKLRMRGRRLRWLRHVNDETLLRAYGQCRFTVYPSLLEGFGLPIVESLLHGKPCICGGCLIVDQTDPAALANGIKTLLQGRQLYSRLCDEARARKFRTWSDYMEKFLAHLQPGTAALASH